VLTIVGALLGAGVGLPFPEDLTLLGAGYLIWRGLVSATVMVPVALGAVLAGDSLLFAAGRRIGGSLTRSRWLQRHLHPERMARVERFFARHGAKSVLLARFIPGARAAFYFTAGAMRLPYRRFLLFDVIGASLSVPFWITLGYLFGGDIHRLQRLIHRAEHWVLLALAVVALAWFVQWKVRRRMAAATPEQPPAAPAS
jgi:membrane protein DedA with SNARE-associated domain